MREKKPDTIQNPSVVSTAVGRGGKKSLLCDPGSEVRLGGIEKKEGRR